MKSSYLPEALLLEPSLIKTSFEINQNDLKNFTLYQLFTFTSKLTKKTFTTLLNEEKSSNKWFIPQLIRNKLFLHELSGKPIWNTMRCSVNPILKQINRDSNDQIKDQQEKNTSDHNLMCPCTDFTFQSFSETKCKPIGIQNCKTNLEILLRSLGLYDMYSEELKFCSILSLAAFDIGNFGMHSIVHGIVIYTF